MVYDDDTNVPRGHDIDSSERKIVVDISSIPQEVQDQITELMEKHPSWGAEEIYDELKSECEVELDEIYAFLDAKGRTPR
jgi:hypothetical protein